MNTVKRSGAFISYSRKDKDFALEFAREMKSAGFLVWLDQLDIPTGARWDDEVEKALRECEIFLIVLTTASVSSDNVKDEIGYAIDHGKRIMPVLLENCDVPLRLRRFQYVDFTKVDFKAGIQRAKQLLETLLAERSAPAVKSNPRLEPQEASKAKVTPAPPQLARNRPDLRRWVGAGVGILLFAACFGVLGTLFVFRDFVIPSTPTQVPTLIEPIIRTATELPTEIQSPVLPTETSLTSTPTNTPTRLPTNTPTLTATSTFTFTPTSTPTSRIRSYINVSTGFCLDSNLENRVYAIDCNGGNFQNWDSQGKAIVNVATGLCLDSNAEGRVYAIACNGGDYQKWNRQGLALVNVATGRCLDSNVNNEVYTLDCNGGNFQNWK